MVTLAEALPKLKEEARKTMTSPSPLRLYQIRADLFYLQDLAKMLGVTDKRKYPWPQIRKVKKELDTIG